MTLKGTIRGSSRDDIRKSAKAIAAQYYGTECVTVELSHETTEMLDEPMLTDPTKATVIGFEAVYEAEIRHDYWQPLTGFPKCGKCGVTLRD